jgi:LysR family transcriptional activator of nhaA
MEWLNYHHLLYFWTVVRSGTIARAAAELRVSSPAISSQLRQLEESLGEKLFVRVGRKLELTETGRTVLSTPRTSSHSAAN